MSADMKQRNRAFLAQKAHAAARCICGEKHDPRNDQCPRSAHDHELEQAMAPFKVTDERVP